MIATKWVASSDGALCGARCAGSNGDAMVFVHGVGSTAAIWDYQLNELENRYRCYAIELRGNGCANVDPSPSAITREGYVDDVIAVANAAGAERFHFIGCSLGAVVGFELWKRSPERVRSFIFIGAFAAYPDGEKTASSIIAEVLATADMRAFAEARAKRLSSLQEAPQRYAETIEQYACKNIESYLAATQATWTGDYRALLGTVSVPTLVLCGEHDQIAPLALSREIAEGIPSAQLTIVGGANHVANADQPRKVNRLIDRFCSGVST